MTTTVTFTIHFAGHDVPVSIAVDDIADGQKIPFVVAVNAGHTTCQIHGVVSRNGESVTVILK